MGEGRRAREEKPPEVEACIHTQAEKKGKMHLHPPHVSFDLHPEAVIFRGLAVLGNLSHDLCAASTRLK
jgi:hypothetical protein